MLASWFGPTSSQTWDSDGGGNTGSSSVVLSGGVDGVLAQTVVQVHVRLTVPEIDETVL